MSLFIVIAGLLVLLGVAALTPAMLRKQDDLDESSDKKNDNIIIAKDRLAEIQMDLDRDDIDQQTFEQAREELEQGLMLDIGEASGQTTRTASGYGRSGWLGIAIAVPLLALFLYQSLGAPEHMQVAGPGQPVTASQQAPTMDELVAKLKQRLQQTPEDGKGWFLLGRTQSSMGNYQDAVHSFENAVKYSDSNPAAQIALADMLAMTQGGEINGRSLELVNAVLAQEPDNTTAQWLAGKAARQRGEYQQAIDYWQMIMPAVQHDAGILAELNGLIEDTRQQAASEGVTVDLPATAAAVSVASAGVPLKVSIDASLLDKVSGDATLFIFAKRVSGPPMPVAAIRGTAGQLPLEIELNDGHMLTPGGRLTDFAQLRIGARISLGGQPIAQPGDLQSAELVIEPGKSQEIILTIDQVVPAR